MLSCLVSASEIGSIQEKNRNEIIKSINKIDIDKFSDTYANVVIQLEKENNINAKNIILTKNVFNIILFNYKKMLYAISKNESNFIYRIGLQDENDLSFFQVNIGKKQWPLSKLADLTGKTATKERLICDTDFAAFSALHVLIYNTAIYLNYNKISYLNQKEVPIIIGTYNNPINLNWNYINQAKFFLALV